MQGSGSAVHGFRIRRAAPGCSVPVVLPVRARTSAVGPPSAALLWAPGLLLATRWQAPPASRLPGSSRLHTNTRCCHAMWWLVVVQAAGQIAGETDSDISFLRGWDSMDAELSAANRQREYGFLDLYAPLETMNERED